MDAFNFIDSWGAIKQRNDLIMLILTFSLFQFSLGHISRAHSGWSVACQQSMFGVFCFDLAPLFSSGCMRELRVEHSLAHSVCVYVCFRSHSHSHCYLFRVRISRTLLFSVNVQSRRNEMNLKHELNMKWCVVHWWIRDLCKIQFSQCMCMCWYIWMYVL